MVWKEINKKAYDFWRIRARISLKIGNREYENIFSSTDYIWANEVSGPVFREVGMKKTFGEGLKNVLIIDVVIY